MEFNKRNTRAVMGIVAFGVALFVGLWHWDSVTGAFRTVMGIGSFFIIGLSVAFVLNAPMRGIETRLFAPLNRRLGARWAKMRRTVALVITVLLLLGLLFLLFFMIIPELGRTFAVLAEEFPKFVDSVNVWLQDFRAQYGDYLPESLSIEAINWASVTEQVVNWLRSGASSFLVGTFSVASSLFSGMFATVVGLILSVYVLASKERLSRQVRRLLYAYLPQTRADRIREVGIQASNTFGGFLSGQFLEAVILGALCFIGMSIFRFRFAPVVSMLVGVTSLIPIFGAFIGVTVGAFLILVNQGLAQAGWFIVFFLVLQQIEGNLIYPHVVGRSVKLPGMWVLVAATLGGNIAGVMGMLLSIPLSSLLYSLMREAVNRRNVQREIPVEKIQ